MILLRYYKTRNKERKVMGYMKTLITHIHCVCFLVGVWDYRSHTSILIFLISLFFLSCSHFRLSTVFKPSYMKLWKEFRLSFLLTLSSTTSFIMFWNFSMFYQTFLSPQLKRCVIITYKHGMYELPHQLLTDVKLRILGN